MNYPTDRLYHSEHTWLLMENDDTALIGITFFAQDTLGDIVEIGFPPTGGLISKGVSCGTIESRKAVSDIIAPASGTVVEINIGLGSEPFLLNDHSYCKGWIARIKLSNLQEYPELMHAEQYKKHIGV
jgi:glycine cleavage system H protein